MAKITGKNKYSVTGPSAFNEVILEAEEYYIEKDGHLVFNAKIQSGEIEGTIRSATFAAGQWASVVLVEEK